MRRALLLAALAAPQAWGQAPQPCAEVKVGTAQSYACLNQQLGAVAQKAHDGAGGTAPYDARSPAQVTGQFDESATRNRLGSNFGHSVTPQRPAAVFAPANAPR